MKFNLVFIMLLIASISEAQTVILNAAPEGSRYVLESDVEMSPAGGVMYKGMRLTTAGNVLLNSTTVLFGQGTEIHCKEFRVGNPVTALTLRDVKIVCDRFVIGSGLSTISLGEHVVIVTNEWVCENTGGGGAIAVGNVAGSKPGVFKLSYRTNAPTNRTLNFSAITNSEIEIRKAYR